VQNDGHDEYSTILSHHLVLHQYSAFVNIYCMYEGTCIIIDFPDLGSTYNGGWCTATKTR